MRLFSKLLEPGLDGSRGVFWTAEKTLRGRCRSLERNAACVSNGRRPALRRPAEDFMYKLYTRPNSGGFVVEAALALAGVPFDQIDVPKPPDPTFLAISPLNLSLIHI